MRRSSSDDAGLGAAVEEFVRDVHPVMVAIAGGLAGGAASGLIDRMENDVAVEASNLTLAVIDADGRHTDVELLAYLSSFGPRFDTQLGQASPEDMRRANLATGKCAWLGAPSEMFQVIAAADQRNRTSHAWTYYDRAMRLAHTVCALDSRPSDDELRAVDAFRGALVAVMTARGIGRTGPTAPLPAGSTGTGPGSGPLAPSTPGAAGGAAGVVPGAPAPAPPPPPEPLEDLLAELDGLVGLAGVKAEVRLVTNLLQVQQLRKERDLPVVEGSRHLIFTGNPGTGKTTVARLLARIYRTLGVVEQGHLVETDRAGLVAGFVGQTAIKVTEVFDHAMGGVLLIDEAYALARGGERDFGREAIDTIVKLIEDRRDALVVIAAGYPDEMGEFVDANPGLRSRFPKTISFADYSDDELVAIFGSQCEKARYRPTDEAVAAALRWFTSQPRVKGFGNGRLARNMFEAAIANQATRLMSGRAKDAPKLSDDELLSLEAQDIPALPVFPSGTTT